MTLLRPSSLNLSNFRLRLCGIRMEVVIISGSIDSVEEVDAFTSEGEAGKAGDAEGRS